MIVVVVSAAAVDVVCSFVANVGAVIVLDVVVSVGRRRRPTVDGLSVPASARGQLGLLCKGLGRPVAGTCPSIASR
eukprot:7116749-Pyramimonas_sp.AAC.1